MTFEESTAPLTIPGAGFENELLRLTADDVVFFGPPNAGEKAMSLEQSLRSADNNLWLSLQLLNVRQTRIYALDSDVEGRITLLVGRSCSGGMGDLPGQDCWYSSDFFHDGCWAAIETLTDEVVEGHINCRMLGALCRDGSGLSSASATCG